jgi:hypothetical protein
MKVKAPSRTICAYRVLYFKFIVIDLISNNSAGPAYGVYTVKPALKGTCI